MSYILSNLADEDFLAILRYTITSHGPQQMLLYQGQLEAVLDMLADNPDLGRKRNDIRLGLRQFPALHHVVFYSGEPNNIIIQRILGKRQNAAIHFQT